MTLYHIHWNIEIDADSAEEAARKALATQRDTSSIATVFNVHEDGAEMQKIDLGQIDADALAPLAKTRDLGLAIRDFIEGKEFFTYADNENDSELSPEDGAKVETVDCSNPDNLIVCLDNGQRFTVRIIAGADTRASAPDAGSLELDRAMNALRILRSIDKHELDVAGVVWGPYGFTWEAFREDPYQTLIGADGETARKVWAIVNARQPDRLKNAS